MTPDHAIVIGAGIAGCSTAYALAERGMRVRLIERHAHLASAASGNPLAMLYPRLSGDDIATAFALAGYKHSLALYNKLQLAPADFKQCGLLQLGFNDRELARIKKVAAQFKAQPMLEYLTAAAASHVAGISLDHDALYFPDGAWINPLQLCARLIDHKNITLITLTKVDKILKNKELFEIYSEDKLAAAAAVVVIANANDAYSFGQGPLTSRLNVTDSRNANAQLNLAFDLQTQAVRGQISLLNATAASRQLQTIVCSDGYISPVLNEQHCLGASFNGDSQDLSLNAADHLANLDKLNTMSPALYQSLNSEISGGRAALRCSTSDYLPLVGELLDSAALTLQPPRPNAAMHTLPWIKGLYVNLAHGSKGFSSAPLCAALLASMICQQPLPLAATLAGRLNPNRFLLRALGLKHLARMVASAEPPPVSG
jgi:tRNA 5-methylaminomethyl-2-thiouridine biosynthesis bifunctional protein